MIDRETFFNAKYEYSQASTFTTRNIFTRCVNCVMKEDKEATQLDVLGKLKREEKNETQRFVSQMRLQKRRKRL